MGAAETFRGPPHPFPLRARRLVVVDNAHLLVQLAFDLLLEYVEHPAPKTVLALVPGEPRKAGRKEKEEKKPGKARPGPTAAENRASRGKSRWWIARSCRKGTFRAGASAGRARSGKPMDSGAARALVELTGGSLGQLDGQIQSLIAYCKERPRITEEDVANLVGGDRARKFWDLTNAVTARDAPAALRALDRLLRDVESPGWLIVKMGAEMSRLIALKDLAVQRLPQAEIERRADVQPWLAKKLLAAIRNVSAAELKANLRLVLEADVDCKTGGGRDSWILERLVLKLCRAPATSARGGTR